MPSRVGRSCAPASAAASVAALQLPLRVVGVADVDRECADPSKQNIATATIGRIWPRSARVCRNPSPPEIRLAGRDRVHEALVAPWWRTGDASMPPSGDRRPWSPARSPVRGHAPRSPPRAIVQPCPTSTPSSSARSATWLTQSPTGAPSRATRPEPCGPRRVVPSASRSRTRASQPGRSSGDTARVGRGHRHRFRAHAAGPQALRIRGAGARSTPAGPARLRRTRAPRLRRARRGLSRRVASTPRPRSPSRGEMSETSTGAPSAAHLPGRAGRPRLVLVAGPESRGEGRRHHPVASPLGQWRSTITLSRQPSHCKGEIKRLLHAGSERRVDRTHTHAIRSARARCASFAIPDLPHGASDAHVLAAPPDVGEAIGDREARVDEIDSSAPSYGSLCAAALLGYRADPRSRAVIPVGPRARGQQR